MRQAPADIQRRTVLQVSAGLLAAAQAGLPAARAATQPPPATGRPGDFDFLSGEWKIAHRRLKDGVWDNFDGEATVHGLLGGIASVEELRIPARGFSGLGLRLLDTGRGLWADYWVNGKAGVLTPPPSWGSFVDGVGLWDSDEEDGGQPIVVRGAWDQITPGSCRWYQAVSRDGGRQWQENWVMRWTRA
ncbi:hypothetical protein [uncultured Methylibium sp.]|uniref:hypothetical protein n=1 Tax=uncultured Methylibium sp. TaxID=381093 RepID=UPI0025E0AB7A|nr:hypothetical protein [uncultured Methylibium sp.]